MEVTLRIRPEDLIAGGRHKAPLRRLVAAHVPGAALPVKKVDFTEAVHDVLRPHQRPGGVFLPASAWIVTATAI